MTSTTRQVRKVAVLGANGAMGSGGGELFAADGIETIFLARDHEKAREGLERAQSMAKSEKLADFVRLGTYDHDLPRWTSTVAPTRSSPRFRRGCRLRRWPRAAAIASARAFSASISSTRRT